jgi:catechol 2,3-dioxygenase-like lactoylglutathione lyase family enzyme
MTHHQISRDGPRVEESRPLDHLSRRGFPATHAAAIGLLLSFRLASARANEAEPGNAERFAPTAFIRIQGDGQIVLTIGYIEIGQGANSASPLLIAEELEWACRGSAWSTPRPTSSFTPTPCSGCRRPTIRVRYAATAEPGGATARTMLVASAAKRWDVDPAWCRALSGEVLQTPSGSRSVDGTAVFGIDVRSPGVKVATLAQPPVFGGRVMSVDNAAARPTADMKLEVVTIPVSNLDRAKEFYVGIGWRLDADFSKGDERVLQFTPPGSQCSIHFGTSLTPAAPGSIQNLFLIVSDIQAARDELVGRGAKVSEVFHYAGVPTPFGGQINGLAPDHMSYGSYASFKDPDGNGWLLQEVTTRFPGGIDSSATTFVSASYLASAMRRASDAHGEHEKRIGQRDEGWPDWYAEYIVAEQEGMQLPS